MSLVCVCKTFPSEAIAKDCGKAYSRAYSSRVPGFRFAVLPTTEGVELRLYYQQSAGTIWGLEHDGFRACKNF